MKVILTKRSNFNIDDLNFLTEALLQEDSNEIQAAELRVKKAQEELNNAQEQLNNAKTNKNQKKAIAKLKQAKTNYAKAIANYNAAKNANKPITTALTVRNNDAGALTVRNNDADANTVGNNDADANTVGNNNAGALTVGNNNADALTVIEMMKKFGNSITGMFQWLMDQIGKLPGRFKSIGKNLKSLWGKIKGWMLKFHIVDRAKSLSMITIACIKFVAFMVARWIYGIIFKEPNKYTDRILQQRSTINTYAQQFKNPTAETAVFIETLGEILREDSNGRTFMAMIRGAFRKDGNKAITACKACLKSSDSNLRKIGGFLTNILGGTPKAENTIPSRSRRRLYNETTFTFDDSLPALYESIIREAQAHKIKEIKKKARKKVAIKKARSKKALRGRI